mmetsp:Transcript_39205/g.92610  ORF Transcript_39205/g.92610 Transcript_39205/m.92610 type:complete len:249 (-) Transcript_39205:351-1097(-)
MGLQALHWRARVAEGHLLVSWEPSCRRRKRRRRALSAAQRPRRGSTPRGSTSRSFRTPRRTLGCGKGWVRLFQTGDECTPMSLCTGAKPSQNGKRSRFWRSKRGSCSASRPPTATRMRKRRKRCGWHARPSAAARCWRQSRTSISATPSRPSPGSGSQQACCTGRPSSGSSSQTPTPSTARTGPRARSTAPNLMRRRSFSPSSWSVANAPLSLRPCARARTSPALCSSHGKAAGNQGASRDPSQKRGC